MKNKIRSLQEDLFRISIIFLILAISFIGIDLLLKSEYITQIGIIMLFLGVFLLAIRWVFKVMLR